ncbi:MAG TPA: ABC transporter ATP-binding protein [Thermoplasmata archaeon]|nr:ABC transporter ATP-binding protein [Thermoplasmata archaeon]
MNEARVPQIRLSGVAKRYAPSGAPEVHALSGIDLAIAPGEAVSIEGPSGCGKTTLLNLLGLLDVPTSGVLSWDGRPVGDASEPERARFRLTGVGFIFQRFYLIPTLTAMENVELPMRALGRPRPFRLERARRLLEDVGLADRGRSYPHELSGGEEQRVAIARALANEPGLLLADEPTGELDSANADQVLELLLGARRRLGATLVVVTHNPGVSARASRHLTMKDGRIVADSGAA